jgi:hypothetical protein
VSAFAGTDFGTAYHCNVCCPWYEQGGGGDFGSEFGTGLHANCSHPACITLDHPVGSLLDQGGCEPGDCLPWKADLTCCGEWDGYDPHVQRRAVGLAWTTMTSLTAGRVASCCVTLRPCLRETACTCCFGPSWAEPYPDRNGVWQNPRCTCQPECSCCDMAEIVLPGSVAALLEVNIDGYRHDPRLFRLDNGNRLVRQDGCNFPGCQNMGAPYGYIGTFGVQYVPGIVPSTAGLWAVGVLACEYAKACSGTKCRLPQAATSISRQGVTMELPHGMFDNGTGIREVDAYVHSVNPHGLRTAARVFSPDMDSQKHRITTRTIGGVWP